MHEKEKASILIIARERENLRKTENNHNLINIFLSTHYRGFPGGSDGKASAYNAGDLGSIAGSGRSPGEGNGNPLQYSCLENPMD